MPTLKVTSETILSVDYNDLSEFIKEVTGQDYECVACEEWGNDSQHRFTVDGKLADYQKKDWEAFKIMGKGLNYSSFLLGTILNGLCNEEKIQPGTYVVDVCW